MLKEDKDDQQRRNDKMSHLKLKNQRFKFLFKTLKSLMILLLMIYICQFVLQKMGVPVPKEGTIVDLEDNEEPIPS